MPLAVHADELREVVLSCDKKKPVKTVFFVANMEAQDLAPLLAQIRAITGEQEAPDRQSEEQLAALEPEDRDLAEKLEANVVTKEGKRYLSEISLEKVGDVMTKAFKLGIRGWSNFCDAKGKPIEYEGNGEGPSASSLGYIRRMSVSDNIELMQRIALSNQLTGKERENSDSARS